MNARIWQWRGWQVIKWIWGIVFSFLLVGYIYNVSANPNYDDELLLAFGKKREEIKLICKFLIIKEP